MYVNTCTNIILYFPGYYVVIRTLFSCRQRFGCMESSQKLYIESELFQVRYYYTDKFNRIALRQPLKLSQKVFTIIFAFLRRVLERQRRGKRLLLLLGRLISFLSR